MRVNNNGYDPFWGADPFASKDRPKIERDKTEKGAATAEDNRAFFEGRKKDTSDESSKGKVDRKV